MALPAASLVYIHATLVVKCPWEKIMPRSQPSWVREGGRQLPGHRFFDTGVGVLLQTGMVEQSHDVHAGSLRSWLEAVRTLSSCQGHPLWDKYMCPYLIRHCGDVLPSVRHALHSPWRAGDGTSRDVGSVQSSHGFQAVREVFPMHWGVGINRGKITHKKCHFEITN